MTGSGILGGILSPGLGFGRNPVTGSRFLGGILSPGLGFWAEFYTCIFEKGCIGARVPTMLGHIEKYTRI